MPAQTKLAVGQPGDRFEQQANAVANHVTSGSTLAPPAISPVTAGALSRASAPEEKTPEPKPAQKAEAPKEPEKKPESATVQKAGIPEPEKKEPEQKLAQKAEAPREPERKPVQTLVQRQEEAPESDIREPDEESAVQAAETTKPEEKQPVQRAEERTAGTANAAPQQTAGSAGAIPSAAERVVANPGAGRPMNAETRETLESRMNANLDDVRVHDDREAHEAAREMNARAFTHGNNIWLGRGESDTDIGLMAHEATHVVQQGAGIGVQRQLVQPFSSAGSSAARWSNVNPQPVTTDGQTAIVQRANDLPGSSQPSAPSGAAGGSPAVPGSGGGPPSVTVPSLTVPAFKLVAREGQVGYGGGRRYFRAAGYSAKVSRSGDDDPRQRHVWDALIEPNLATIRQKLMAPPFNMRADRTYLMRATGLGGSYDRIGNPETLATGLRRPFWHRDGKAEVHHVDHVVELQIAGWPRERWGNNSDNLELLNSGPNARSGPLIDKQIDQEIRRLLLDPQRSAHIPAGDRDVRSVKNKYDIIFESFAPGPDPPGRISRWQLGEVQRGDHIDAIANKPPQQRDMKLFDLKDPDPATGSPFSVVPQNLRTDTLTGSRTRFVIYKGQAGGSRVSLTWGPDEPDERPATAQDRSRLGIRGFDLQQVRFNRASTTGYAVGSVTGPLFRSQNRMLRTPDPFAWLITRVPGAEYAGYLDYSLLQTYIKSNLTLNGLSPIRIDSVSVDDDKGLVAVGQILPTVPLINDLAIDLVIEGDDLRAERTFTAGDLKVPRPFQVNNSTLTLSIGTRSGFRVTGQADFAIERVGSGFLGAGAGTAEGLFLEGGFNFDTKLFDPAEIRLHYRDNELSGEGRLGIKKDTVRGIKSATITASYAEGRIAATGTAELSVPGIQSGAMELSYSEADGLAIGGSFELANDIPGIQGGSVAAQVKQKPGEEGYEVTARGTAVPKIPGINATISAAYENGIFTIEGTAAYEKGMLKGSVLVGATNRPIDDQGRPGGDPTGQLRAYGGGSVTIRIAPWLQGTVGIRLLPNGEIEVSGAIGLPQSLDIFPEKRLDRNIFSVGIDIPIVGLSVAGQRVGIFANITGGADLSAGIGPGQLRELGLSITYNPARESETRVTGGAKLHVPAHAGVRLFVRGGLGVGIPLVSAQAGIEIGGAIGLEGALDAGVQVDWTPTQGLRLDAFGEISVEPKLRFDITGFVLVEFDYLIDTATLYEKRWQLAAFEYGSGLRFGVKFPIRYEEGKPFDISLSDVEFQVPDIKPKELLGDLIKQIA